MASSSEDRRDEPAEEMVHKTKVIQFLGRTTPIVLQNDNGPCPLLAICNVLLLKNNMNLSPDIPEVSQEKLLSLVAERLLDSNSNTNNKDAGFVENQQQNISDAIDLLPRLTTGIDVNIKFRRIDDFEFTRECAIFDLLDIPLYHGWIVDPEDSDTATAIGSKSYNTLMGELVSLETQNVGSEYKQNPDEECVDFAAATTATLGVPSPSLSRGKSFDESPRSTSNDLKLRKGDLEEEAELLKALKLSEKTDDESSVNNDLITFETIPAKDDCLSSKNDEGNANGQPIFDTPDKHIVGKDVVEETNVDVAIKTEGALSDSSTPEIKSHNCGGDEHVKGQSTLVADLHESKDNLAATNAVLDLSRGKNVNVIELHESKDNSAATNAESDLSGGKNVNVIDLHESKDNSAATNVESDLSGGKNVNIIEALTPVGDGSEPIYEGEECILESRTTTTYDADREPMYEGEVVLAEQVEKDCSEDAFDTSSKDDITPKQGELIRNFLNNSASQLTIYGLFRLQEGPKERELCVFFRNNHFSTMFKFDGELYLLATDQGYLNQPDLVWEKLNEVNGNTLFMTSNFKEFKVDSPTNSKTWDEQNAMANTAEYLASIDNSAQAHSNFTSDLELAIALQQQEYEQQQQPNNVDRPNVTGGSRLVTGPQRSSANHPSSTSRQEAKQNKDKCIVM